MPWAIDGTSVPAFELETKSAAEVFAHSSNLSSFMPRRTGIEPLLRLNTSWNSGDMIAVAKSCCAF